MKQYLQWILLGVIFLIGVSIAYYLNLSAYRKKLPVYGPEDLNPQLVENKTFPSSQPHRIPPFSLIDQQGNPLTEKKFEGKIYVTDFFFTSCPSICPKMTTQMARIQDYYKEDNQVLLLSHTVQPEVDSVPVLAKYAREKGVIYGKWYLATGDKKHIYDLARKAYFAAISEGNGSPSDFIHTQNFILIDPDKRIRGIYDGTSANEIDQLIEDIQWLKKEYEKQ